MGRGLAFGREAGGQNHLLHRRPGTLQQLGMPMSLGPTPSMGDSRPIST
jgi:hypothetical protein